MRVIVVDRDFNEALPVSLLANGVSSRVSIKSTKVDFFWPTLPAPHVAGERVAVELRVQDDTAPG